MLTCGLMCIANIASQALLSNKNGFCTQVTPTGYSNIALAPQLTSLDINHPACGSMCMLALAQLSTLVFLQEEAGWGPAAVEQDEVMTHSISFKGHRCRPPRSLGLLKRLQVLRFVKLGGATHGVPVVLMQNDVDLPDLDPEDPLAHMRLLGAVQTGCTTDEDRIGMVRDKDEDDLGPCTSSHLGLPSGVETRIGGHDLTRILC